jgi:phosphatidylglycerophosphate synthase
MGSRRKSPRLSPITAAMAAFGLLVLAATAAPEGLAWLRGSGSEAVIVLPDVPDAFAYLIIFFMLSVAGLYCYLLLTSARKRPVRQIAPMGPRLALLILLLAAWALLPPVQNAVRETLEALRRDPPNERSGSDADPGDRLRQESSQALGYALTALLAVVIIGVGAGVVWVLREDPEAEEKGPPSPPVLAAGVELSITDLERIAEPRAAILACYGRLQSAADEAGVVRRPSDAPFELLARLLHSLGASGAAARRLTELFERARFSDHEIDEAMRKQALEALAEVRTALAARA